MASNSETNVPVEKEVEECTYDSGDSNCTCNCEDCRNCERYSKEESFLEMISDFLKGKDGVKFFCEDRCRYCYWVPDYVFDQLLELIQESEYKKYDSDSSDDSNHVCYWHDPSDDACIVYPECSGTKKFKVDLPRTSSDDFITFCKCVVFSENNEVWYDALCIQSNLYIKYREGPPIPPRAPTPDHDLFH
jgi:hypothetical protein